MLNPLEDLQKVSPKEYDKWAGQLTHFNAKRGGLPRNKLPRYDYPLVTTVTDFDGVSKEICVVDISSDTEYHLKSTLETCECDLWNDEMFQQALGYEGLPRKDFGPKTALFSEEYQHHFLSKYFPRFPVEIQLLILRALGDQASSQRVVLRGPWMPSTRYHSAVCNCHPLYVSRCNGTVSYRVPGIMFANKKSMDLMIKESDFVMLTEETRNNIGQVINLKKDMLILHEGCSDPWTGEKLRDTLTRAKAWHKVKSIAISPELQDFPKLLDCFRQMTNLELVFIIVASTPTDRTDWQPLSAPLKRKWTHIHSGPDPRISHDREVMYELLHPDNLQLPLYHVLSKHGGITQSGLRSCKTVMDLRNGTRLGGNFKNPQKFVALMHATSREVDGRWVCPTIRYVRAVNW